MILVTGESIKSAISLKIRESLAIGDPVTYPTIYKEAIAQGFVKPSFHISTISVDQRRINKTLYERLYQMNVRYHIDQTQDNLVEQLDEMGSTLFGVLNTINVPITDPGDVDTVRVVHATSFEYTIEEGVLQVFVNYIIKVTPFVSSGTPMQELTVNQSLKEA